MFCFSFFSLSFIFYADSLSFFIFWFYRGRVKDCKGIVNIGFVFAIIKNMNQQEIEKIKDEMRQKIKEGVDEDELLLKMKEKYGDILLKNDVHKETSNYLEEENPLLLLAEENGALRALMKNIRFDFSSFDDVSFHVLKEELKRLDQIRYHYLKIDEVLLYFLKDEKKEKEIKVKEKNILNTLAHLNEELDIEKYKEDYLLLLDEIEKNIVYENHFLLPCLEERLNSFELQLIWISFLGYQKCLLR